MSNPLYSEHKGFDASHFQGDPNEPDSIQFGEAFRAGYEFCFIKATQGTGYVDPTFANRQPRVRAVFPVRGFYHFVGSSNAQAEGEHFANIAGPLQACEYAVFDVEDGCGLSGSAGIGYVLSVVAASGYAQSQVIIYLSDGWANGVFGEDLQRLTRFHLWDARYSASIGSVAPWSDALVWQDDEAGTVPGIGSGTVDIDWWMDGHWPVPA